MLFLLQIGRLLIMVTTSRRYYVYVERISESNTSVIAPSATTAVCAEQCVDISKFLHKRIRLLGLYCVTCRRGSVSVTGCDIPRRPVDNAKYSVYLFKKG